MERDPQPATGQHKLMKVGMLACCAVMLAPLGAVLITGRTLTGVATNAWLLAPLALCLGAHVVTHRMMGKSCHKGAPEECRDEDDPVGEIAVVGADAKR